MIRRLTQKRKSIRREVNYQRNMAIYDRAKSTIPADYLACNQTEAARVSKVIAESAGRRQRRNAKRLSASKGI